MSDEPSRLRIERIHVEGLAYRYHHEIPLRLDHRVTILQGPNGVGKTAILTWIDALLRLDLRPLLPIPFDRLTLGLSDGSTLCVQRIENDMPWLEQTGAPRLELRHDDVAGAAGVSNEHCVIAFEDEQEDLLLADPEVTRRGPERWELGGEVLGTHDAWMRRIGGARWPLGDGWITDLVRTMDVRMVDATRALPPWQALVEHMAPDELARRIELFGTALDGKLDGKRVRVGPQTGPSIVDHEGDPLAFSELSAGERWHLAMLHTLAFETRPGSLVLIDEPERSQPVAWQRRWLAELLAIATVVGFDALVATHSPFVVGGREDLVVRLPAVRALSSLSC